MGPTYRDRVVTRRRGYRVGPFIMTTVRQAAGAPLVDRGVSTDEHGTRYTTLVLRRGRPLLGRSENPQEAVVVRLRYSWWRVICVLAMPLRLRAPLDEPTHAVSAENGEGGA